MPGAWKCTNCRLAFPGGWFHYWIGASPYWAATLLVCRGCGTAHAIEHSNEKPTFKDRLFHAGKPFIDDDEPAISYDEDGNVLTMKWYRAPPVLSNWPGGSDLTTDKIAELACVHCGGNSLTDRWEENWPCPRCASEMKEVGFWIT